MKSFLIAILMAFSMSAMAVVDVDTRGLNDTQKAELVKMAEQMKQSAPAITTAEKVDQWVNVGERIGKMLGGAAKEVGLAVNEFVKTPVGMLATGVIVFNYIGGAVIHVFGGLFILLLGTWALWYYVRNSTRMVIEYDLEKPANWLGNHPVKKVVRDSIGDDQAVGVWLSAIGLVVVSLVTMFTW
jgi:hypothetical protein